MKLLQTPATLFVGMVAAIIAIVVLTNQSSTKLNDTGFANIDDTGLIETGDTGDTAEYVWMTINFVVPDAEEIYEWPAPRETPTFFVVDGHATKIEGGWDGQSVEYIFEWLKDMGYTHEIKLENDNIICGPISIYWDATSNEYMDISWEDEGCYRTFTGGAYQEE